MVPISKYVTVNGVRLRYLDWGTRGLPPMVCLHGHTGQARIWDEFAEVMRDSFHVYAVDQRGHGESAHAMDGYARDRFVEDLAAFVDALELERFTLSGLSMGGWHSMLYTAEHPDRVERIVMVDIGPEPSEESIAASGSRPLTPMVFDSIEDAIAWMRSGNPWASDARLSKDARDKMKQTETARGRGRPTRTCSTCRFQTCRTLTSSAGTGARWRPFHVQSLRCAAPRVRWCPMRCWTG